VGCGDAVGALACGCGAAEAADDSEPSGAPARSSAREERREWKSECVKARVNSLGAQGCASNRGGGTASKSRCWQAGGVRGGSGDGGATWRGGEKPAEAGQAVGTGVGGHVARGQLGLGKRPAEAAGSRARAEQGEGLEVEDRDLSAIFQKCRGSTVKPN
jgi:hypothetical protein